MRALITLCLVAVSIPCSGEESAPPSKKAAVRVFILAGQSNMEGKALASTLEPLITDAETRDRFQHLKTKDRWTVRDDVHVTFLDRGGRRGTPAPVHGPLSVGYGGFKLARGADGKKQAAPTIGPELGIGDVLGDHFDEPVLLIKTAWGGRSLKHTFRPPSAAPSEEELAEHLERVRRKKPDYNLEELRESYGSDYRKIISETRRVLESIEAYVPGYDDSQGYQLSGVVWFQGWNDGVGKGNPHYTEQLADLIRDLRRDLKSPDLPFVIGELGVDGVSAKGWIAKFREQQAAVAELPEFEGSVAFAKTAHSWHTGPSWMEGKWEEFRKEAKKNEAKATDDPTRVNPGQFYEKNWREKYAEGLAYTSDRRYHYNGSGKCYYEMGQSMGKALLELVDGEQ